MDCIFCKIIANQIPSYVFYEDDIVKVFLDINPKHTGHSLIVTKEHFKDLYDIPEDILIHIFEIAKKIGTILTDKLHCDGITLVQNNGIGEEIKHFHLHVVPQYKNEKKIPINKVFEILN